MPRKRQTKKSDSSSCAVFCAALDRSEELVFSASHWHWIRVFFPSTLRPENWIIAGRVSRTFTSSSSSLRASQFVDFWAKFCASRHQSRPRFFHFASLSNLTPRQPPVVVFMTSPDSSQRLKMIQFAWFIIGSSAMSTCRTSFGVITAFNLTRLITKRKQSTSISVKHLPRLVISYVIRAFDWRPWN